MRTDFHLDRLGIEWNHSPSNFSDPLSTDQVFKHNKHDSVKLPSQNFIRIYLQNVTSNPQFISSWNANSRSNLEFPLKNYNLKRTIDVKYPNENMHFGREFYLTGHHFRIYATDVDSGIQTSLVMCIYNVTTKSFICSNPTVIWALDAIKTIL